MHRSSTADRIQANQFCFYLLAFNKQIQCCILVLLNKHPPEIDVHSYSSPHSLFLSIPFLPPVFHSLCSKDNERKTHKNVNIVSGQFLVHLDQEIDVL